MSTQIFLCYAQRDRDFLDSLKKELESHRYRNLIGVIHEHVVRSETTIEAMDEYLKNAHLVLPFISQYFLNSDYCYGSEMTRAIARHQQKETRVIPILLRPVYWERTPFAGLQPLPKNGIPIVNWSDKNRAFQEVADGILRAASEVIDADHQKMAVLDNLAELSSSQGKHEEAEPFHRRAVAVMDRLEFAGTRRYEARQMDLATLATRFHEEMERQKRGEAYDDQYILEIFHRAIFQQVEQAWEILVQLFSERMRVRLHNHPSWGLALRYQSEDTYIAMTFERFWQATRNQQLKFPTLGAALSYLNAALNGVILDTLRSELKAREIPLPEVDTPDELVFDEKDLFEVPIWESLQELLRDARERRLVYLLYSCGLKARQIVALYPQEFQNVTEIYHLNRTILGRLRRNKDRLRWLLSDEET